MAKTTTKPTPLRAKRAKLPDIKTAPIFSRGPKHLQPGLAKAKRQDFPSEEPPNGLVATKPEWYAYWALTRLGKIADVDFSFQSSLMGGRLQLGGVVLDFLMYNPPDLGINIQGIRWHYGMGGDRKAHDAMARMQIEGLGIKLVYIDEDHILANPVYYVEEALRGIDHSRMEA